VRRYKRNPDTGDWIFYGGIAIAAYFAWQWLSGKLGAVGTAATAAYNAAVNTTTNAIAAVTNQNQIAAAALGPMVYRTVIMPDGTNASIPSTAVGANNQFLYQGNVYTLSLQGNTYYATAVAASIATLNVNLPTGTAQIPATSVSGGTFTYQGAGYMLVNMPDGSLAGVFPSSIDTNSDFIYWNDGVTYNITSAGGSNIASVVTD
jgi:hypothetical protein